MAEYEKFCNQCQRSSSNLKRCTNCLAVSYCSKNCQTKDWPSHRPICRKPSQTKNCTKEEETGHLQKSCDANLGTSEKGAQNVQEVMSDAKAKTDPEQKQTESPDENIVTSSETAKQDMKQKRKIPEGPCTYCSQPHCYKRCSKCRTDLYCSKRCQEMDWPVHKRICNKELTDEDIKILASYRRYKKIVDISKTESRPVGLTWQTGTDSPMPVAYVAESNSEWIARFQQELTLEQAMHRADRPVDSLSAAVAKAKASFPGVKIFTSFLDVPYEYTGFYVFPYAMVAFMYRYHEHVMRHGVYLKDDRDKESKVEFYLDDYLDDPWPYFTYGQVKPGGYIFIRQPEMHVFGDGTVGIRVNHPAEVSILNVESTIPP